jgi:hypothetical protein
MVVWHVILTKRETHLEREIARALDEKMWKDKKTQEKKKSGTRWIFVVILILVMIKDAK